MGYRQTRTYTYDAGVISWNERNVSVRLIPDREADRDRAHMLELTPEEARVLGEKLLKYADDPEAGLRRNYVRSGGESYLS